MVGSLRRRNGFTLVETVVAMAIVAIAVMIIFGVYLFGVTMSNKGSDQSDVQRQARLAAQYITSQMRTANYVEILSSMPGSPDPKKKYFYVQGDTLRMYNLGTVKDILSSGSPGFTPALAFDKNAGNGKVLDFSIACTYKEQDFSIESQVLAQNIIPSETIKGLPGSVVAFSCPLTASEKVTLDTTLLDLGVSNAFLVKSSGILTLNPPPGPNSLTLPVTGDNGSTITWSSSDMSVIRTDGTVIRPGIDEGDATVVLTAVLALESLTQTKQFTVVIRDLDPLVVTNPSPPHGTVKKDYDYVFSASGGNGSYTFSASGPISPLTLNTNGLLSGRLGNDPTTISFNLTVTDGLTNTTTIPVSLSVIK